MLSIHRPDGAAGLGWGSERKKGGRQSDEKREGSLPGRALLPQSAFGRVLASLACFARNRRRVCVDAVASQIEG